MDQMRSEREHLLDAQGQQLQRARTGEVLSAWASVQQDTAEAQRVRALENMAARVHDYQLEARSVRRVESLPVWLLTLES